MKILLHSEHLDKIKKSGLGKSIQHQMRALEIAGIEFTTDSDDDFDLLHINTYFPKSMLFARKTREKGIPIVYHAHSTEEDFRDSFRFSNQIAPLFKQWLTQCYKLGDIIITPTTYSKKILDTYELETDVIAISNGIDLERFTPIEHARDKFLQKYGYNEDDFVVMAIGLYLKRKGILDFVELAKRMPDVKFIWFGFTDLSLVPDEIEEAVETKLPNLHFAGYVDNQDILLALQGSDLYIFPTYEETEGIPAIEACASKADFIVRDIPVFDDWLIDGETTYKAKDIDEFEDKIRAFKNKELPSLTEAAYQVALERDLPAIGEQLREVYEQAYELAKKRQQHH